MKAICLRIKRALTFLWRKIQAAIERLANLVCMAIGVVFLVSKSIFEFFSQGFTDFMNSTPEQRINAINFITKLLLPVLLWIAWTANSNGNVALALLAFLPACYGFYILKDTLLAAGQCLVSSAHSFIACVAALVASVFGAIGAGAIAFFNMEVGAQMMILNWTLVILSPFLLWKLVGGILRGSDDDEQGDVLVGQAVDLLAMSGDANASLAPSVPPMPSDDDSDSGSGSKWLLYILLVPVLFGFFQLVNICVQHGILQKLCELIVGCVRGIPACIAGCVASSVAGCFTCLSQLSFKCCLDGIGKCINGMTNGALRWIRNSCREAVEQLHRLLDPVWQRLPPQVKDVLKGFGKCLCALPVVTLAFLEDSMLGADEEQAPMHTASTSGDSGEVLVP